MKKLIKLLKLRKNKLKEFFFYSAPCFYFVVLAYMSIYSIVSLEFFMSAFTAFISLGCLFQFIRDQIHYDYFSPSFSIPWHKGKRKVFFHICGSIITITGNGYVSIILLLDAISKI